MAARVTKRQVERLLEEIHRYLKTVDAFRAQGREPTWRAESPLRAAGSSTRPAARKQRGPSKPREKG